MMHREGEFYLTLCDEGRGGREGLLKDRMCRQTMIDPGSATGAQVTAACHAFLQLSNAPSVIKPRNGGIHVPMSPTRKLTSGRGSPSRTSQLVNGGRTQTQIILMLLQALGPLPRLGALQVGCGDGGWVP